MNWFLFIRSLLIFAPESEKYENACARKIAKTHGARLRNCTLGIFGALDATVGEPSDLVMENCFLEQDAYEATCAVIDAKPDVLFEELVPIGQPLPAPTRRSLRASQGDIFCTIDKEEVRKTHLPHAPRSTLAAPSQHLAAPLQGSCLPDAPLGSTGTLLRFCLGLRRFRRQFAVCPASLRRTNSQGARDCHRRWRSRPLWIQAKGL